jgi:hypothetical protein
MWRLEQKQKTSLWQWKTCNIAWNWLGMYKRHDMVVATLKKGNDFKRGEHHGFIHC